MNTKLFKSDVAQEGNGQPSKQVVIVGGGIAGLSAAWYLQQKAAEQGLNLQYTVLEQSNRWGGKIQTEQIEGFGDAPFILEGGPDAILTRKPWALALAHELGLNERILSINQEKSRTFVVNRGKLTPLPDGLQLLVPTKLMPFLKSPLFSLWGKLRVAFDLFVPRRESERDETLANFVRRRLGVEMLDKLAEPLLSGVYNAEAERQSILATFPQFPALEKRYGSLIKGARATRQPKTPDSTPPFISFETGTHELINSLVSQLTGDLRLEAGVSAIERTNDNRYIVTLDQGEQLLAEAVIMATPAKVTAPLLTGIAADASAKLDEIRYSSIGAVYLGFHKDNVSHPLDGFGFVVPSSEHRQIDGMTWMTSKWNKRAPSNHVLLRVFFGGPHTRNMMQLSDADLLTAVRAEVQSLLGINTEPVFSHIFRWHEGYPQYDLDHLERVAAIEAALPAALYVTGSSYHGIGVPDCIKQGQATAQQVLSNLTKQPLATPSAI
ncbi:MAG: protoporphyrinogen oxidase [Anaerolineae bacterium]|nr:protoporphyrinogen oxidase [Anaerolineae bacterium]